MDKTSTSYNMGSLDVTSDETRLVACGSSKTSESQNNSHFPMVEDLAIRTGSFIPESHFMFSHQEPHQEEIGCMREDELEFSDTPFEDDSFGQEEEEEDFQAWLLCSSIGSPTFELMCGYDDFGGDEAEDPVFLLAVEIRCIDEVEANDDEGPEYLDVGEG